MPFRPFAGVFSRVSEGFLWFVEVLVWLLEGSVLFFGFPDLQRKMLTYFPRFSNVFRWISRIF